MLNILSLWHQVDWGRDGANSYLVPTGPSPHFITAQNPRDVVKIIVTISASNGEPCEAQGKACINLSFAGSRCTLSGKQ